MAITPADRAPAFIAVYSFMLALTTTFTALRVYTRVFLVKCFALDDWLAVVSWVTFTLFNVFAIIGAFHGTGQHAWNIQPPSEIPIALKWWWVCEPVYVVANMTMKASIALMLLRFTLGFTHRVIIFGVLAVTLLFGTAFFFVFIFQCQPVSYFWTQYTGGQGSCIDSRITVRLVYVSTVINCVGDWAYAILPFFLVWNLQMNFRTKISVALILAMGAIASTATIIRIPYIHTLTNTQDFLYATVDFAIWSCSETGLGLTAACAATLRPLLRVFLDKTGIYSSNRRTAASAPTGGRTGRSTARASKGYIRSPDPADGEELGLATGKSNQTQVMVSEEYQVTVTDRDSASNSSTTGIVQDGIPMESTYGWAVSGPTRSEQSRQG